MTRGRQTRDMILAQALDISTEVGLEGLTIGSLASQVGMSKSGLYAHFGSKEELQIAVLDTAAAAFIDRVIAPALKEPRGVPRLMALYEHWLTWSRSGFPGGCPFVGAATELDDRPGPVRDRLIAHLEDLLDAIERAAGIAVREGQFRADADLAQFAYEFWANVVNFHLVHRLLRRPEADERARAAFNALVDRFRTP